MPYLANPISPEKDKITLKMKELTDAQQLQELLAAKQQAEAEENKRKKREYNFLFWTTPIASLFCGAVSLVPKSMQIYNEHLVNNHSFWVIFKDFFTLTGWNFNFWGWLIISLLALWIFSYTKKELQKLNQPENTV
jgi:hypothetical protein